MKQPGKYALTGALAGLANGLFGSGGGLFLVPLFTGWEIGRASCRERV